VPGMVAQQRGWPHRAGGDRGDTLHWSDVTALSRVCAGLTSVPFSKVPPSPFEGCDVEAVQEWAAQCHRVDTGLPAQIPHSSRDGLIGRVGGTTSGYDSQAVSEGRCDAPGFLLASLTLMAESAKSNRLTLVKPRSTGVITSKTSPTHPINPLDQVNTPWW
jgi:hypothetical protein